MLPSHCPNCTYDLTGAPKHGATILCPECGCDTRVEYQKFLQRKNWYRRTTLVISGPPVAALALSVVLFIFASQNIARPFCFGLATLLLLTLILWAVFGPLFWWSWRMAEPQMHREPRRAGWVALLSVANLALAAVSGLILAAGLAASAL